MTPRAVKYPRKGAPDREVQRGLEVIEDEAHTCLPIFNQFLERLAYRRQNYDYQRESQACFNLMFPLCKKVLLAAHAGVIMNVAHYIATVIL